MKIKTIMQFLTSAILTPISSAQNSRFPITFTAPKSWRLLETKDQNGAEVFVYKICEDKISDGSQIPSNAVISKYKLPDGISSKDADAIVASRVSGSTLIISGQDGESWKTYLYVFYEGKQQLIIFYRIGIYNGFGVEAMICFPHIIAKEGKSFSVLTISKSTVPSGQMAGVYCNPSSVSKMVIQFNELCSTLKISGVNTFAARAELVALPPQATCYQKIEEG